MKPFILLTLLYLYSFKLSGQVPPGIETWRGIQEGANFFYPANFEISKSKDSLYILITEPPPLTTYLYKGAYKTINDTLFYLVDEYAQISNNTGSIRHFKKAPFAVKFFADGWNTNVLILHPIPSSDDKIIQARRLSIFPALYKSSANPIVPNLFNSLEKGSIIEKDY